MVTTDQRAEGMRLAWERERATDIDDRDDEIRALAEEVYADYEAVERQRLRGQKQAGALAGLGYEDWILPGDSYTAPDTDRRRQKILHSLAQKPYGPKLFQIGLAGHPRRKTERKVDYLKFYCRVEGDTVRWGLAETKGRDVAMGSKYDRLELRVLEGSEVVAEATSEAFDNSASLAELGLHDDDYRFQVGARNDSWGYSGSWFDWAIVDGAWTELESQGHDWDGEVEGSTRRHSGGPDAPAPALAPGELLEAEIAASAEESTDELQRVLDEVTAARKGAKADIAATQAGRAAAAELRRQADRAEALAGEAERRVEPQRRVLREKAGRLLELLQADEDFPGIS